MSLAQLAYRIATDSRFAADLQHDFDAALTATGLSLDESEIAALRAAVQRRPHWKTLCFGLPGSPDGFPWWGAQFNPLLSSQK